MFTEWQSERCDMTCWPQERKWDMKKSTRRGWLHLCTRNGSPFLCKPYFFWKKLLVIFLKPSGFLVQRWSKNGSIWCRAAARQCAQHLRDVGAHKDEVRGAKSSKIWAKKPGCQDQNIPKPSKTNRNGDLWPWRIWRNHEKSTTRWDIDQQWVSH